jgi:hypothetical protein
MWKYYTLLDAIWMRDFADLKNAANPTGCLRYSSISMHTQRCV